VAAIVSDDEALIQRAYMFRDFGRDAKQGSYAVRGTNYRISDFAAAVLMAQLTRFDELCARRETHAAYLREELKNTAGIVPQEHYAGSTRQNYYCFGLRYDAEHFSGAPRVKVIEALSAEGIPVTGSRGFRAVFSKERLERYRHQNHLPQNDNLRHKLLPSSVGLDRPEERRGRRLGGVQ